MRLSRYSARALTVVCVAASLILASCAQKAAQTIPNAAAAKAPIGAMSSSTNGCDSSITANFNGTPITANSTIWFTAAMKLSGIANKPATINISQSTIAFTANGAPHTVTVPDAAVTVNPGSGTAAITFSGSAWSETVPYPFSGNVLLDAVQLPVSNSLPGGIQNVTWSGHFTSTQTGISVHWAWSAATYTQLSTDYNALGVKPVDANDTSQYLNSDHAGTPEHYKSSITAGATGGGGSNYTGGLSGTASVTPCLSNLAYVTDQSDGLLYVINLDSGFVQRTLTLNGSPNGLVVGSGNIWVTNNTSEGGVFEIDSATYDITSLDEGGGPATIAYNQNAGTLYALNYFGQSVTPINASTAQIGTAIQNAGARPAAYAIDVVHSRLYEMPNDGTLRVIDTSNNSLFSTIQLGAPGGNGVVLSPDGSLAYAAVPGPGIVVVNTTAGSVTTTIPTCSQPDRMAKSSDGSKIYAFCEGDGTVAIFSAGTQSQTGTVTLDPGHFFGRLASSNDGKTLYVPSDSNKIFVLNADTLDIIQTINVTNPQAIALPGATTM